MDRNALDWLFSTLPQAIAALVGLLFAGTTFFIDHVDEQADKDDSKKEIFERMKSNVFEKQKRLFYYSGISIAIDVLFIITNPLRDGYVISLNGSFDWYFLAAGLLFVFNLFTLYSAFQHIATVSNPRYFEKLVKEMAKENESGNDLVIEPEEFISAFIELERYIRSTNYAKLFDSQFPIPLSKIMERMRSDNIIGERDYANFRKINSIRNLIVHGGNISRVSRSLMSKLTELSSKIENRMTNREQKTSSTTVTKDSGSQWPS